MNIYKKLSKSNERIKLFFEKGYRATEDGRIISNKGKELKLAKGSNMYLVFGVSDKEKSGTISVHRFVAYCKYGEKVFEAECVRHKDSDRNNNSFNNILLGSLSDNYNDNSLEWKASFARKGAHSRRKLTDKQAKEIKIALNDRSDSISDLARKYNVSYATIVEIKKGRSYSWITT